MIYKQEIRPALINATIKKLIKINPFYGNITVHEWEDLIDQSGTVSWKFLTHKNAGESTNSDQTDSHDI